MGDLFFTFRIILLNDFDVFMPLNFEMAKLVNANEEIVIGLLENVARFKP